MYCRVDQCTGALTPPPPLVARMEARRCRLAATARRTRSSKV